MAVSVHRATSSPPTPPAIASSNDSVRSWVDDVPAPGADREPNGHLGRAARRAAKQEIGDVGAANQQHDHRHAEQQRQGLARLGRHAALTATALLELHLARPEFLERGCAHPFLERHLHIGNDVAEVIVQGGPRLLERDARLQATEQVDPVRAAIFNHFRLRHDDVAHRNRNEKQRAQSDRRAVESARRDTDDRERLAVHQEHLVDHVLTPGKSPPPVFLAQDDHVATPSFALIARPQEAAGLRRQTKHLKVTAGHERAVSAF